MRLIEQYQPQDLAIETLFFSKNKKTALQVSEARGVILSCAGRNYLDVFEYCERPNWEDGFPNRPSADSDDFADIDY